MAQSVSATAAITRGFYRMKRRLFPFDLNRWLILGFCAWIVTLGENGGGGGGNWGNAFKPAAHPDQFNFWERCNLLFNGENGSFAQRLAECFNIEYTTLKIILGVILFVVVLLIAVGVVTAWVKSRFNFIWLHNLLSGEPEIKAPWSQYKLNGNSLFWGRLTLWALFAAGTLLWLFLVSLPFLSWLAESGKIGQAASFTSAMGIACGALVLWFLFAILIQIYFSLLFAFLPPIMYKTGKSFSEAFHAANALLFGRFGQCLKLWLVTVALTLAASIAILLVIVMSCCILAIPLMIPFIGTVLLLPLPVFMSYFNLEFLAGLAPEYNLFPEENAIPTAE